MLHGLAAGQATGSQVGDEAGEIALEHVRIPSQHHQVVRPGCLIDSTRRRRHDDWPSNRATPSIELAEIFLRTDMPRHGNRTTGPRTSGAGPQPARSMATRHGRATTSRPVRRRSKRSAEPRTAFSQDSAARILRA